MSHKRTGSSKKKLQDTANRSSRKRPRYPEEDPEPYEQQEHKKRKPFRCNLPTCPKRFDKRGNRDQHERTHTMTRAYECKLCHDKFAQQANLSRHEKSHKCKRCPAGAVEVYKSRAEFEAHYKDAHPGVTYEPPVRNFRCTACTKLFKAFKPLEKHIDMCEVVANNKDAISCERAKSKRNRLSAMNEPSSTSRSSSPIQSPAKGCTSLPPKSSSRDKRPAPDHAATTSAASPAAPPKPSKRPRTTSSSRSVSESPRSTSTSNTTNDRSQLAPSSPRPVSPHLLWQLAANFIARQRGRQGSLPNTQSFGVSPHTNAPLPMIPNFSQIPASIGRPFSQQELMHMALAVFRAQSRSPSIHQSVTSPLSNLISLLSPSTSGIGLPPPSQTTLHRPPNSSPPAIGSLEFQRLVYAHCLRLSNRRSTPGATTPTTIRHQSPSPPPAVLNRAQSLPVLQTGRTPLTSRQAPRSLSGNLQRSVPANSATGITQNISRSLSPAHLYARPDAYTFSTSADVARIGDSTITNSPASSTASILGADTPKGAPSPSCVSCSSGTTVAGGNGTAPSFLNDPQIYNTNTPTAGQASDKQGGIAAVTSTIATPRASSVASNVGGDAEDSSRSIVDFNIDTPHFATPGATNTSISSLMAPNRASHTSLDLPAHSPSSSVCSAPLARRSPPATPRMSPVSTTSLPALRYANDGQSVSSRRLSTTSVPEATLPKHSFQKLVNASSSPNNSVYVPVRHTQSARQSYKPLFSQSRQLRQLPALAPRMRVPSTKSGGPVSAVSPGGSPFERSSAQPFDSPPSTHTTCDSPTSIALRVAQQTSGSRATSPIKSHKPVVAKHLQLSLGANDRVLQLPPLANSIPPTMNSDPLSAHLTPNSIFGAADELSPIERVQPHSFQSTATSKPNVVNTRQLPSLPSPTSLLGMSSSSIYRHRSRPASSALSSRYEMPSPTPASNSHRERSQSGLSPSARDNTSDLSWSIDHSSFPSADVPIGPLRSTSPTQDALQTLQSARPTEFSAVAEALRAASASSQSVPTHASSAPSSSKAESTSHLNALDAPGSVSSATFDRSLDPTMSVDTKGGVSTSGRPSFQIDNDSPLFGSSSKSPNFTANDFGLEGLSTNFSMLNE